MLVFDLVWKLADDGAADGEKITTKARSDAKMRQVRMAVNGRSTDFSELCCCLEGEFS
jgi:hypothetical protein